MGPLPQSPLPPLGTEQYTPDKADWRSFYSKAAAANTDHSPDGIPWIKPEDWLEWDGTVYDPTKYSKKEFGDLICNAKGTIRGLRTLFYQHKPFADNKNPTKAEVDNWHALAVNHVRAMVGYTGEEYAIKPDHCLHVRSMWSNERHRSRMWDAKYPSNTCVGTSNPHCGATFIPSVQDQQEYLPDGISSCGRRAGSEGIFSSGSNIPWSIKWARSFCSTMKGEGFWGGHTGPWFHRSHFGWSWWDTDPDNQRSGAILVAKWGGNRLQVRYENPDITSGRFLVNGQSPRFPGFECLGIKWKGGADSATACYEKMLQDDSCGKRFMTYNVLNNGCACYAPEMNTCDARVVSGRTSFDFEPVQYSFDGYFINPDKMLHNGKRCENIVWLKGGVGDASHCLQKIIETNYSQCGRNFVTFNANGGGCACYPPGQTTCGKARRESGRQTFEIHPDPAR